MLDAFERRGRLPRAFTLMELMVSISLLVLIILAVSIAFQGTSRAVGLSKSTIEMLSNVRSMEQQLEQDVRGLDRNCFLIIRPTPNPNNAVRSFDQISFISLGSFHNATGIATTTKINGTTITTPFTDNTITNAAFIWWGQLVLEMKQLPGNNPTDTPYIATSASTTPDAPSNSNSALPSGIIDGDFMLGRNAILLLTPDGTGTNLATSCGYQIPAYTALDYTSNAASGAFVAPTDSIASHITKSRVSAVLVPEGKIARMSAAGNISSSNALDYCYRFASMRNPYESDEAFPQQMVNGYFRMHPIALQGVCSFQISYYGWDPASKTWMWFTPTTTQCWTSANPSNWPKALKFAYHVADPTGRIPNGRDFVEIVKIPD